jgi:hypothetical protein
MAYARVLMGYERNAQAREQLEIITNENPEFADAWLALAGLQFRTASWKRPSVRWTSSSRWPRKCPTTAPARPC